MDLTAVVAAAHRVLTANPYGFLTTSGAAGPTVRMVQHLSVDEGLQVVFGTERGTRKEVEIAANPDVVYAVADRATRAAVCLYGAAVLDDDPGRRRALWRPELSRYFPDSPDGPAFVLVSIVPDRVEVWSRDDDIHPEPIGRSSAVATRSPAGWTGPTGTHPERQLSSPAPPPRGTP
jgi:general stress protein 26